MGGGLSQTKNLMLEIYQQKSDNKMNQKQKNANLQHKNCHKLCEQRKGGEKKNMETGL